MGYFSNDKIAGVDEPEKITLAHSPNFIRFFNKGNSSANVPVSLRLKIINTSFDGLTEDENDPEKIAENFTKVSIIGANSELNCTLRGTYERNKANITTFYIARQGDLVAGTNKVLTRQEALSYTAQNLKACIMQNTFLRNNYNITVPVELTNGLISLKENSEIEIVSKGYGPQYDLLINAHGSFIEGFPVTNVKESYTELKSKSTDTIDAGIGNYQIELDVYTDTGLFLGESDIPSLSPSGKYLTSLSKAYYGGSTWFDPNLLVSRKASFSADFIDARGWCNAGTISDYRFTAKRTNGIHSEPFYYSEVLYIINGYDYTLQKNNISDYVFDTRLKKFIKPLTNRPATNYISGQKQYFNFILKDTLHSLQVPYKKSTIGILYKFKTQSGTFIDQTTAHLQTQEKFNIVNTVELDLDKMITQVLSKNNNNTKTIGRIEVFLCCDGIEVSQPIVYNIYPNSLHSLNNFAFLNRLGGWDSFNFDGINSGEFKTSAETIYETLMPGYHTYSKIESVAQKLVTEQKVVKSGPVPSDVVEWLRELSASTAVYELASKRYVIVDELVLKNNEQDNLFQVEMKYHYSDTFNGR